MSTDVAWVAVGNAADWPEQGSKLIKLGKRRIAIFHHAGTWNAVDDRCPHERVSLANGKVHDGCVVCPGHHWSFRLNDGKTMVGPEFMKLATYPIRIQDGVVEIQ